MTKEELIALSDLNREDNIKYISSEAQGISIALDSDRYVPTFCKLERAYICGRRKSEEQIEQLEKENAKLKERLAIINLNGNIVLRELTKAKYHIKKLLDCLKQDTNDPQTNYYVCQYMDKAEQFLNSEVVK